MEGVILFADNNVLIQNSFENKLFTRLSQEQALTVLPICSLSDLAATLKTTSTYKALILDWNFSNHPQQNDEDFEDLDLAPQTPENTLDTLDIYSLIYVYSQNQIPQDIQDRYKERFPNKIQFNIKNHANIDQECAHIQQDLQHFSSTYPHMDIPYIWSQSINQSVQKIFRELESANSFWIKEVRDTAIEDGGEPITEIIDLFNNLLSEELVQNESLRASLDNINGDGGNEVPENTAKLYQRIYYSQLTEHAPIMTGDIFHFADDSWGILITPECEVTKRTSQSLELDFLTFRLSDVNDYLQKSNTFDRIKEAYLTFKESRKEKLRKIFNNEVFSSHVLPSFPSQRDIYNQLIVINFKNAYKTKSHDEYANMRSNYKLNSPYIHQLRQRFIAFFGKIGVPAIPISLRDFNLNAQ